ncbi:MAG: methyltransferase domain-containing protein [Planctomycetes bacterium]|nr:methyltransferase domain-containing protein [Planctomycetota bacterium]
MSAADEAWYVAAFQGDYIDVYPHRDLDSARSEVAWLLARGVKGRVLDLCCGFGRHTLALAERDVDVVGMDLSWELLSGARKLPGAQRIADRLVRGDAKALPFHDAGFDAVVNLFSSFGYFGDDGDRRMLDEIARVLRPGGLLVMDLMNPARVRAGLVPDSRTMRDGMVLEEQRALVDDGRRVTKHVTLTQADGRVRTWHEDVRMYEIDEIQSLLATRGLVVTVVEGGFMGEPAGPLAPRQIVRALKTRYHSESSP